MIQKVNASWFDITFQVISSQVSHFHNHSLSFLNDGSYNQLFLNFTSLAQKSSRIFCKIKIYMLC